MPTSADCQGVVSPREKLLEMQETQLRGPCSFSIVTGELSAFPQKSALYPPALVCEATRMGPVIGCTKTLELLSNAAHHCTWSDLRVSDCVGIAVTDWGAHLHWLCCARLLFFGQKHHPSGDSESAISVCFPGIFANDVSDLRPVHCISRWDVGVNLLFGLGLRIILYFHSDSPPNTNVKWILWLSFFLLAYARRV